MEGIKNVRIIGSTNKEGKGENQFAQPRGVCINHDTKELFIVDCNNHRIQVYHMLSLAYIRQVGKGVQSNAPGCLMYPVGICMDDSNHIFVADTNNHRIVVFNHITGCFVRIIGSQGSALGCLNCPYGVCLDLPAKHLYVADYENNRIQIFHKDTGDFVKVIGGGFGISPGKFNQPIDVSLDFDNNHLYVADYANNRIQVLDKDTGNHVHTIAPTSTEDAFNGPRSLCINRETGLLFVSDRENHRIQMYNMSNWQLVRHIGLGMGVGAGQFNRPMELCVDNEEGVLIAVDGYNHRVQIIELPELRDVRERLRALKVNKTDRINLSMKDVKPSHVAMTSQITSVDACLNLHSEVPYYLAHFDNLGPTYDVPIQLADEEVLQPLISAWETKANDFPRDQFDAAEITPPTNESLRRQGQSFLAIIKQLALEPHDESLLSLASPSLLALQSLLSKGWHPVGLSEETIKFLLFVMHNLKSGALDTDETVKVLEAVGALLMACVQSDKACCDCILQHLIRQFKMGVDYCNVHDANRTVHNGSSQLTNAILMLSLDLLSVALGISDRNLVRTHLEANQALQDGDGATETMNLDLLRLIFGVQLTDFLRQCYDFRQCLKLCHDVDKDVGEKTGHDYQFAITPYYLGDLLERALQLNSCFQEVDSSSVSESFMSSARCSFLNCCADVFTTTRNNFEGKKGGKVGNRKFRGGRNVWTGDVTIAVGDLVDCMDKEKSWFESLVLEVHPYGAVKVHFLGWGSKWDDTIAANEVPNRIAPLNTHTKNWRAELFEGGLIEIKCNDDLVNQKWMWGKITRLNMEEAWLEVAYSFSNEPVVVKKAWIYGETICPVGMHTKDKSKAAAAQIVKPTKTVDDILREKASETGCTEDRVFFDFDDDHVFEHHADHSASMVDLSHTSRAIAFHSPGVEESSIISKKQLPGYLSVALYIFHSCSRCVAITVTEHIQELLEGDARVVYLNSTLSAAMKVLQALMLSPWKNLVARHILRPLYVHAGVCAKLLSSKAGAAKELRSQNWSNIFALSVRLERIKQLYSEVISQLFSKMLSKPAEEFIKARISRTVDCCGFNSVASEMITFFRADSKAFTAVLKPLVTDQRYHVEHAALRNLFRGIVSAVSPRLSQDLVSVVESNLIFDRIDTAIAMCRSDVGIKQLVSCFSEGKVISTNEVITDPRSRFAVERAVVINTSRLGAVDAMQYAHVLAEGVSNYFASSPKSIGAVEADTLQYILQICTNEEVLFHFRLHYMRLLLSRILEGSSGISQTERSFLLSLAIGCEISDSLLELDTAHILSKGFMCYLQLRSDRDEITDKETLSLLESEHSLSVLTLNASKWSKIIQYDTLRLPVLPKIFSRLRGEYERFYRSQHPDSRKMRFVWCYGQGCVQLAIYVNEREVGEVTVNEIECATLKLLQHGFQTIRSLAVSLNLDEENMKVIIASLQELHNPNGVVLVEVKNGGIVCLSSKLSHDNLHDASFLRDTSIVRKTTIKELNTGNWRHSVIDAAVMRVVKKHSRHESLPANAALLVSAAVKELHTAYPNTLFQTEEVKRQFCSLVDAGCIAEDILVEDRYALMQTRHRKTPTERSPGSIPLGGHTQNYHACKIYSEKSYSDGREVPALLPYEPTFKEDLLRWIADFSWTIDYNATSLSCYGSRIPLPIHGVAYTPSVPTVGFRHWLDLCARDLWRSSILSMAALLRELNMLVHQLVCKQHNVDYRIYPIPKLATLEDSLRDIHGQYDANMSDIILLQLFLHIFNSRRYFSLFLANICVTAVNSKDKNVLASCCASLNTCTTEFLQVWKGTFELKVSISQIFQQFEESYEGSANTTMANANSSVDLEVAEGKDNYSESEDIKGYCDDNIAEDDDQAEYAYSLYDLIVSVFEAAWDEADTLKSVSYLGRPSSQVDLFPSLLLTNKSLAEGFSEKSSPPTQQIYSTANRHEKKEALDGRKSSKADENDSHRIQSLAFTLQDPGSPDHFIERMHRSPPPLRSVSRFESPWRTETKEVGGENSSVNPHRMQFMMPPSISNELEHMSRRLQDFRSSGSAKAEEMFSIPFPVNELSPRVWETDSSPTIHLNTLLPNYSSFLEPNARSDTNPISGTASKFIDAKLSSEGKSPYKSSNSSAHTNYSLQSLSVIVSGVTRKVIALLAHKPHRTDSVSEELLAGPVDEITKEICNYTLARMSELATRSDSSRLVWWFADAPLTVDSLLESVDKLLHKPVKASKPISALELCQLPSLDELCGKMDCNQEFKSTLRRFSHVLGCHWSDVSLLLNFVAYDENLFFEQVFMPGSSKVFGTSNAFTALSINDSEIMICEMCKKISSADTLFAHTCGHYACKSCWQHHISGLLVVDTLNASECRCWKNGCTQVVDARLVHAVLGPAISSKMLKMMYREHEALYRAAAEKASIRRTQSLSKCVFKEASLTCSLCEIKPANLAGKEHHKNIEDRLATQLKTIHEQWLRAQNTEEFLSLLDLQRFWCLYFECLALIEHIQVQSSKQEAEVLVRERSVLDAALSDLSAIHRPLGKHISSLRGVKSRLMSIYLDQCVLCTPGRYSIKDRHETEDSHRVHNALPFSSHLLELKSSSPYFSLTGNKKRTSEELCALLEHPNELSELEQKQALQELLSYIEGGAEESNVTLLRLWSLLCQFVRRAYITEVDTLSVLFEMKLKLLSALRHGNSEESLCAISFKHVWRFLLICRCDLGVLTMLLKVILELAAITPRFIDSFSALDEVVFVIFNQVENDSHVRILLLRTLLVFVLGPLSAQCLTRAPMTDEAGFERLSHALHELFKEFEGEGTATESDLDTFMYEVIDLLTTPHVFSALPERWKHSVIPLSCLSRMLRHLKSLAANKNSSAADLHKVCVFMMRISKTYGRYAGSLRLSVELVEMLRSVDTTNTSHLLAACSAIGKLIISFCMREPSLKEALKDSELVNALKEKKHQVVQLVAAGPRDSADLINRCNMSAFTLTTAVQSIVLGQPQDAQNLDILTSLGY